MPCMQYVCANHLLRGRWRRAKAWLANLYTSQSAAAVSARNRFCRTELGLLTVLYIPGCNIPLHTIMVSKHSSQPYKDRHAMHIISLHIIEVVPAAQRGARKICTYSPAAIYVPKPRRRNHRAWAYVALLAYDTHLT